MVEKTLADKLAKLAVTQIKAGISDPKRKTRLENNKKNSDAYDNIVPKAPEGEFSFAIPVYSGFEDTLVSKLNDPIKINFDKQEEADLKKAKKVNGAYEYYSAPARGAHRIKDIHGKKHAARGGIAIFEKHAEQRTIGGKQVFVDVFRNVKAENFYCQPKKGWNLEDHRFNGELEITKTKTELDRGVTAGNYSGEQVKKLGEMYGDQSKNALPNQITTAGNSKNPFARMEETDEGNYAGEPVYSLVGHNMEYEGKRYYLLLDWPTGLWVRCEDFDELYEKPADSELPFWNYCAWHTHPSVETFWTKSPGDDVRPIHENVRVTINLAMLNLKKRTKPKRAADPAFFPDIKEISDSVTEVVEMNAIPGRSVGEGVYEFKTEDNTAIIVNLVGFINGFLGEKTGITPGAEGAAKDTTATVYVGNIEQVANRMSLYSEFYRHCWATIGLLFFLGLRQHMTPGIMARILGLNGYEWQELLDEDVHPIRDYDIRVSGGTQDSENSQIKLKAKNESLDSVNTLFPGILNPLKASEEKLRVGGWDDEDIKALLDRDAFGTQALLSEAAQAIEDILNGLEPKVNRKANEAFVLKIIDYADDCEEDNNNYEKLYAYAYLHLDVVAKNAARKAIMLASMAGSIPGSPMGGGAPAAPGAPTMPPGAAPASNPLLAANAATIPAAPAQPNVPGVPGRY